MRRFQGNAGFYFMLVALVMVSATIGCAKKHVPLNPPRVQAVSGAFESGGSAVEEIAPPQSGGVTASATAPETPATADSSSEITEETLSEKSSSFPKGSFRPGESHLSGGGPGAGGSPGVGGSAGADGSFQPGESYLSGGAPGAGGRPGAGGGAGASGSFQPGESYLSGGAPGAGGGAGASGSFTPGSPRSRDLSIAKMIPFKETSDLNDIHFKFDKYELSISSQKNLTKNARWMKTHPDVKVEIQGHCDERGTNNYNLGLGERRALSAKKFLIALGISESRLLTISYGEEKPFCAESNENCWWQNRRGHFLVSK